MDFFKPEDFSPFENHERALADFCNAKLAREGQVVWQSDFGKIWLDREDHTARPINKALLIRIEKIETCKHEKEKIKEIPAPKWSTRISWHVCECGANVKPTSFEEVK